MCFAYGFKSAWSKLDDDTFATPESFHQLVGAQKYGTITRPDFFFSMNKLSQFIDQPTSTYWLVVKRVL